MHTKARGDLPHNALREQVTLTLFSGLSVNCFTKLKGCIIRLEKGCSPGYPQGTGKRKTTSALKLYHAFFLMCSKILISLGQCGPAAVFPESITAGFPTQANSSGNLLLSPVNACKKESAIFLFFLHSHVSD